MTVYVVRQPIFDRTRRTTAYELTLRCVAKDGLAPADPGPTSRLVMDTAMALIRTRDVARHRRTFLNVARDALVRHHAAIVPGPATAVEVVVTDTPDPELLGVCRALRRAGCLIALDDVVPGSWSPDFAKVADVVKVDFAQNGRVERQNVARYFHPLGLRLVAEAVRAEDTWREAADAGYDYFEGPFYTEPAPAPDGDVPVSQLNVLRLLQALYGRDTDLEQIERLVKSDVSLSLKLLGHLNTAAFGFRQRVTSIQQALLMLGVDGIRKWAAVIAVADAGAHRPFELVVTSAVRARLCEQLAADGLLAARAEDAFLMGLFSLLDALLGRPLEALVETLAIADDVRHALTGGNNPMRRLHEVVLAYERGDWGGVVAWAATLGVDPETVPDRYCSAIEWANSIVPAAS